MNRALTARLARTLASTHWGRHFFIAVPFLWLALFFLVPFLFVFKISLSEALIARPPYAPVASWTGDGTLTLSLSFFSYQFIVEDALYFVAYLRSLKIAALSTVLCLIIGYPMAYGLARAKGHAQAVLLTLVILPFWTSFLIRVYAWKVLLQGGGILNAALMALGVIDRPLAILYSDWAVYLGIVYSYLPFMILPLYAQLARLDFSLIEAALDLGSRPWQAFLRITLPLSLPGVIAGAMLVFIPAIGEFVIPELLGGPESIMIGRTLWNEFFANRDWPMASAVAVVILILLLIPIIAFQWAQARTREG
ncbi:MAG: ABC transporter permease subunit [Pseudomonadota bacterium]